MKEHILSIVWLTPLVGMFILLLLPKDNKNLIRIVANLVAFIGFLVSLPLVFWFDKSIADFQFVERLSWIPSLGVDYHLGIDGVALLLIMLTTVVGFLSILSSWAAIGFAPTLVAGIYGMNFQHMPELAWPWGYPFALGLMVAVSAGLYLVFKKKDWRRKQILRERRLVKNKNGTRG